MRRARRGYKEAKDVKKGIAKQRPAKTRLADREYGIVNKLCNQLANALVKFRFMQSISQNNTEKLRNSSKVGIGFDGNRAVRITVIKDKSVFEKIDGSFNGDSVTVKIGPMLCTTRNAGIKTEVLVRVSINALTVSRVGTGMFAGADSFVAFLHRAMADPLESEGAVLTTTLSEISEGSTVNRTNRSAVFVEHGIRTF